MKWLLIVPLLYANWGCLAQEGIYVPDPALREVLQKQGLITGDTIFAQERLGRLDLAHCGIRDLTGLRAFPNLWWLDVSDNELTELNDLPPQLGQLLCQDNHIEVLDLEHTRLEIITAGSNRLHTIKKLPKTLTSLDVKNNPLDTISMLPPGLRSLNIAKCQFRRLPALPAEMHNLNYAANPIDTLLLPESFRRFPCLRPDQNCWPAELTKWNILGLPSKIFTLYEFNQINSIVIRVQAYHSWGFGYDTIWVEYKSNGYFFKSTKAFHFYSGKIYPDGRQGEGAQIDSVWFERSVLASHLFKVLQNLFLPKLQLDDRDFGYKKSAFKINLATLLSSGEGGYGAGERSADGSDYFISIQLIKKNGSIKLGCAFGSGFQLPQAGNLDKEFPIQQMLTWMYLYQLSHLFFPEDMALNKSHFNEKSMERLALWARRVFPELNNE